ncbi:MAG TPA: DUF3828 domain-containing protein [Caulobacterales bacterium]|nr:DUF3828 domain-containing protein [Caulobacterales bacterium]
MRTQTIKRAALAFIAGLALAACDQTDPNGPAPAVEKLFEPYLKGGNTAAALDNAPMTMDLHAVIDKAGIYGNLLNEPVLDFDPIIFAQEAQIKNVRVTQVGPTKDAGSIARASFENAGKPVTLTYEMKRQGGAWLIDNIKGPDGDLRGIIAEGLKPAGEPEAMIAPVKTIYERYGQKSSPAHSVAPLADWAALAPSFQMLMQARADAIKATDMDPLGFDPIVDGTAWDISNLTLEAASSAVIARFKNGPADKVIVYDVSPQDGAWAIDDIRAPGVWDVRFKLEDAGIK